MISRGYLKEKLPYGYAKVVAQKAGVTPQTVSRYLKGYGYNLKIEKAIADTVAELEKKRNDIWNNVL